MDRDIDEILVKVLTGNADEAEMKVFGEWLNANERNREDFRHIRNYWTPRSHEIKTNNEEELRNRIWDQASNKGLRKHVYLRPNLYYWGAAVILFFITSIFIYKFYQSRDTTQDILLAMVEKRTGIGVKSTIMLPEGSMVHLNSNSRITYLKGFEDSVRMVRLSGEAFFEVAHNPGKPFLVEAKGVVTKALGTSFDVNAYDDEPDVKISLVHGSVWIGNNEDINESGIILKSGEYAAFKDQEFVKKGSFDTLSTVGWKDGILVFDKADFKTVIKKLERWYGVTFIYEGEEPEWSFEGVFRNAYLESILDVLKHSERIEYTLVNDTVKLKINEEN